MRILFAASVAAIALVSTSTAFAQSESKLQLIPPVVKTRQIVPLAKAANPVAQTRQIVPVAAADAGVPAGKPAGEAAPPAPSLVPVPPVDTKGAEAAAVDLVTKQPAGDAVAPAPAVAADAKGGEDVAEEPVTKQASAEAPADVTGDIAGDAAPQPKIETAPAVVQKAAPVEVAEVPPVVAPIRKLVRPYKRPRKVVRYYQQDDGYASYSPRRQARYGYGGGYGGYGDGCN